jgi:TfoX/Sxy family transcriptional regulator of competence genes
MAYNIELANRVRDLLNSYPDLGIEEKKMFRGLTFMVNGKMCVSVSHDNLMCRFDPSLQNEVEEKIGFQKMIMKGRVYKGYCYVNESGYNTQKDFEYWLQLCLDFNHQEKLTKK